MAYTSVTWSFSNNTVTDATKVNTNFTDIVNGLSDGTKDINVSAGTFAGAVAVAGNFAIATNKFSVVAASGNTAIAGTLEVTGASTFTGAATFTGGVTFNGGITLGAGDSLIGSSTSNITFNTDKFTVAGATGNTVIAGTVEMSANTATLTHTGTTSLTIASTSGTVIVEGLTFTGDAVTGASSITSTTFVGNLTGNVSGTAATVTGATQASITTCANLVSIGTITTGVWNGTTIKANYLQQAAADLGAANVTVDLSNSNGSYVTNLTIDGTFTGTFSGNLTGNVTGNVTGNCSGSAAIVTGAAQTNITSLGTLTTLTVDNITINGSTISHATAANLVITATAGNAVAIEGVSIDGGAVSGITTLAGTGAISGFTTLTTTGNVAINSTLRAWQDIRAVAQFGGYGSLFATTGTTAGNSLILVNNAFIDATPSVKYCITDEASRYVQVNGTHSFDTAVAGNAGDVVSFASKLIIDNAGAITVTAGISGITTLVGTGAISGFTSFAGSGRITTTDATDATTTSNGSGAFAGGISCVKKIFAGDYITTTQYRLSALNTAPANAGATGTLGEIRVVADAIYVCTATNTWVKCALATWS